MTKKDLDCLKKYLDIKVAHCNISETQAQDIYDVMRINCLAEPINDLTFRTQRQITSRHTMTISTAKVPMKC